MEQLTLKLGAIKPPKINYPNSIKASIDYFFGTYDGFDSLLQPSRHARVRSLNKATYKKASAIRTMPRKREIMYAQYFLPLRKRPYGFSPTYLSNSDTLDNPHRLLFPPSVYLVDSSENKYGFDRFRQGYQPIAVLNENSIQVPKTAKMPLLPLDNLSSRAVVYTADSIAVSSRLRSFSIDFFISARISNYGLYYSEVDVLAPARTMRYLVHLSFCYDKKLGQVVLDLKASKLVFADNMGRKIDLYFRSSSPEFFMEYPSKFLHNFLPYHDCFSFPNYTDPDECPYLFKFLLKSHDMSDQIRDFRDHAVFAVKDSFLRVINNADPRLSGFIQKPWFSDEDFCSVLTHSAAKVALHRVNKVPFYRDVYKGNIISVDFLNAYKPAMSPLTIATDKALGGAGISHDPGTYPSLSTYLRTYLPNLTAGDYAHSVTSRNVLNVIRAKGVTHAGSFINSYGISKTLQVLATYSLLDIFDETLFTPINPHPVTTYLHEIGAEPLRPLFVTPVTGRKFLPFLLLNMVVFYSEVHKYHSHETYDIDRIYPPVRILNALWISLKKGYVGSEPRTTGVPIPKLLTLEGFPLEPWLHFSLSPHQFSYQKMRRIFFDVFTSIFYKSEFDANGDTLITKPLTAEEYGRNYSMLLTDTAAALSRLETKCTHEADLGVAFKDVLSWKDLSNIDAIHTAATKAWTKLQHANKKCINPYYLKDLDEVDFIVPGFNGKYKIVFARDTHTVLQWGTEQSHCIGTYTEKLNDPAFIMFGVWDNEENKWFGHCINKVVPVPTLNSNAWKGVIPSWTEWQFYGHRNTRLDPELKLKMMEHVVRLTFGEPLSLKEDLNERFSLAT